MRTIAGRRFWLVPTLACLALGAAPAPAGEQLFGASCTVTGSQGMNFGDYDALANNALDMQGRVSYRCTSILSFIPIPIEVSLSTGGSGSYNRRMQGGLDRLYYNVYTDPQRQRVWGNGTAGTQIYSERIFPNGQVVDIPMYGRVPGAQDVRAGMYADQLIVTIDF